MAVRLGFHLLHSHLDLCIPSWLLHANHSSHLYTRMQDTAEGMPKKVPQNWTSKQWMSKKAALLSLTACLALTTNIMMKPTESYFIIFHLRFGLMSLCKFLLVNQG